MAAQQRMKEFVHEHVLRNRPHALLWLPKAYGILAGMYACQVWGTELSILTLDENVSPAADQPDSRAVGQPLVTLDSNSVTFCEVLKADVSAAFSGMHKEDVFKQKMLSAFKIPMQDFIGNL
eukprot:583424-Pelagomonas_calceolata.AAC.6